MHVRWRRFLSMAKMVDLTGQKFGRLRVIGRSGYIYNCTAWLCECECGNTTRARSYDLRAGLRKSCGCKRDRKSKAKAPAEKAKPVAKPVKAKAEPKPKQPKKPKKAKPVKKSGQKCYNVFCPLRNNRPRGGVWTCTNSGVCPVIQTERVKI